MTIKQQRPWFKGRVRLEKTHFRPCWEENLSVCQLLKYGANGTHFGTVSSGRWSKCCTNETDGCVTNRNRAWETNSNPSYFHAWPVSTWRGWERHILVWGNGWMQLPRFCWRGSLKVLNHPASTPEEVYRDRKSDLGSLFNALSHISLALFPVFFFFTKWSDIFPKFMDFMISIGRMLFISTFKKVYKSMVWFGSGKKNFLV